MNPEYDARYTAGSGQVGTQQTNTLDVDARVLRSEERLQLLVQHVSDVVMIVAADGTIQYLSPAAEHTWGYQTSKFVGTTGETLIHPDDLAYTRFCLEEVAHTPDSTRTYEARLKHAEGYWLHVEWSATNLLQTPSIAGIIISARDISARKRAAAELKRREAVLAAVSFAAEQFLLSVDWDQSIDLILEELALSASVSQISIYENHRAANGTLATSRRFHWAEAEPSADLDVGTLQDLPFDAGGFARWEALLSRGQMIHGNVQTFPVSEHFLLNALNISSILVVPIFVEGEWWGFITFCDAITSRTWRVWEMEVLKTAADLFGAAIQQQRLQQHLRAMNSELEKRVRERTFQLDEANRAKTDFLSRLSHEMRTPLNVILGFAQLLDVERRKPVQHEHVAHILSAGRHLLDLTNETMDIARIETGRLALNIEQIPIKDVISEVVGMVHPLAIAEHVSIQANADSDSSVYVQADRQRMIQILFNLFSNAIKYNVKGGSVSFRWELDPQDQVQIAVVDTGTGIAASDLPRLFQPFERLGAQHRDIEGTGIGLVVSKQLVEAMSGTIEATSTLEQGSTFRVTLPGGVVQDAPVEQIITPHRDPEALLGATPHAIRQLLYIDDDADSLQTILQLPIALTGLRLLTATLGSVGLELALTQRPDVIVLALDLPDRSGEVILQTLHSDPATASIPVIMVGHDNTPQRREELFEAGTAAYLTKPLQSTQLLSGVEAALRLRRK